MHALALVWKLFNAIVDILLPFVVLAMVWEWWRLRGEANGLLTRAFRDGFIQGHMEAVDDGMADEAPLRARAVEAWNDRHPADKIEE